MGWLVRASEEGAEHTYWAGASVAHADGFGGLRVRLWKSYTKPLVQVQGLEVFVLEGGRSPCENYN